MKWFSVLSIIALAFLANACEKHPVGDAPEEGTTAFGEHSKGHESHEAKGETKHGEEATPSKEAAPATPEASKSGEASKIQIFPEKK